MTKVLKLALLGRLQLSYGEKPLDGLVSAKARALLCFLAMDGRSHSRQHIANLLWSDLPEADARRNLRGDLLKLRQFVKPYLDTSASTLAFVQGQDYWLDVEQFRTIVSQAHPSPAQLAEAVALYRGEFLEDFHVRQAPVFEEWVSQHRMQLREAAFNACHRLTTWHIEQAEPETAVRYARQMIRLEPVREEGHRQLMLALALNGRRSAALAQYEACRELLQEELGVAPAPDTAELRERIRSGAITSISRPRYFAVTPAPPAKQTAPPTPALPPTSVTDTSPFVAGPPITTPAQFFGRQREMKRLFHLLKRRPLQNAAVIGPRRSGKTSLLHALNTLPTADPTHLRPAQHSNWLPQPEEYNWIFVDFQDPRLGERKGLLRHLLQGMGMETPTPCNLQTFLDVVSDNLRTPTVVLLDEIGVALERYETLDDTFWEGLRSLATNQVEGNLAFIMTGPDSPGQMAQHSGLGSPFFNIFGYMATLGPFTEEVARALIASSPIPFPPADVAWILEESGRWPFLLQILCQERLFALEEGDDSERWREDGRRQIAPFRQRE